jgi:hypothetical protein
MPARRVWRWEGRWRGRRGGDAGRRQGGHLLHGATTSSGDAMKIKFR